MNLTKKFNTNLKIEKLLRLAGTKKYSAPKLSLKFNCDRKTIYRALKKNNIILPNLGQFIKNIYCNNQFFINLTPTSAYWMGFIASDGTLFKRDWLVSITLNKRDIDHLHKFKEAIKTNAQICFIKKNNSAHINIYSKELFNSLIGLGITPNKSLSINNVKISHEFMPHFIRGVFDGDGWISGKDISHLQFAISGNKPFLEQMQDFLIKKLGIKKTKIYKLTQSRAHKLQYTGSQIFKILKFLYSNSNNNIRLTRKYEKFVDLQNKFNNADLAAEALHAAIKDYEKRKAKNQK